MRSGDTNKNAEPKNDYIVRYMRSGYRITYIYLERQVSKIESHQSSKEECGHHIAKRVAIAGWNL